MHHNTTFIPFVFAAGVALSGCRSEKPEGQLAPAVSKSAEDGGVSLRVTIAPAELAFDAKATLTIEAEAPRGVTGEIADYQELIREAGQQYEFRATRMQRTDAILSGDDKVRWEHVYAVDFFVPGEFDLPPAKMTYVTPAEDLSKGSIGGVDADGHTDPTVAKESAQIGIAPKPKELVTQAIPVKALSTEKATQAATKLTEIKTLPPKELAEPWTKWALIAAAAATVAILAILLIARRVSREGRQPMVIVPPHEWFDRELAALLADDLISKGRIQEFHYRISDILRGYIERRFNVHAREMTTEEFLAAAGRDNRFGAAPTADLNNFLTACDMVKYARHTPGPQQADALVRTGGEFVSRTRERMHRPVAEPNTQVAEHAA